MSRTSPIILLVIVILAIGFFVLGLVQIVIRCLIKRPSFSSVSHSNRLTDQTSASHTFQRQLQQLFRLHDSGLDQALIDALPVFYYKDIVMGSKEPFDCAVCLCEFSDCDKLKFLPNCSHAFHIHCIEAWLLSNSTCPLCRSLIGYNDLNEQWNFSRLGGVNESFSVRLGKFRNLDEGLEREDKNRQNEACSSSIDARRCYSMGAFQYIVDDDAVLQVALCNDKDKKEKLSNNTEIDGKKINLRSRGDSFSVSKIWLWSKRGKFPSSCDENGSVVLPLPNRSNVV